MQAWTFFVYLIKYHEKEDRSALHYKLDKQVFHLGGNKKWS